MTNLDSKIIQKGGTGSLIAEGNPWAGLSSYEDPDTSSCPLKFCGRDIESYDVTQLIDDNILVTLYGKSGTGKTSLLNAGVFPQLRSASYLPISIRLSMDAIDKSFQSCIIAKLLQTIKERNCHEQHFEVVPLPADEQSEEYLWSYFARTHFTDADGCGIFPVLVFDQFEEVFRDRKTDAEALLRQIYYMMDESHTLTNRMVGSQLYTYDFNFRFVLSIREDDLYSLEDSIDNNYLVSMKHCRYRLRSLSEEGARDAILVPGQGLFKKDDEEQIVKAIIETSRNKEDRGISTNLLSLICSRIYSYCIKSGNQSITAHLVNGYIAGNPFEEYYNEATAGLSNKEKSYIEDHLIDSEGRRNSISETDFLLNVKGGEKLLEGSQKILQRVSTSSGSKGNRIELIHDSFCEPLSGFKQKRLLRRRRKMVFASLAVALFSVGIAIVIQYQMYHVKILNRTMLENNARFVSEKANDLTDNGDSYTARQLALYILENRPYVIEAEAALRNASYHNSAVLRGHDSRVVSVKFSSDGKQIISQSVDSIEIIWDASNGNIIKKQKKVPVIVENPFGKSPDGKYYARLSSDETGFYVIDSKSGKTIHSFDEHSGEVTCVRFSPCGTEIASGSIDNTIILWDVNYGITKIMKGHTNHITSLAFSPNGKRLASGSTDNTVRLWDIGCTHMDSTELSNSTLQGPLVSAICNDGSFLVLASFDGNVQIKDMKDNRTIYSFKAQQYGILSIAISPNGKQMACIDKDGQLGIWDLSNGLCLKNLSKDDDFINYVTFSSNGNYIASASEDSVVYLWDAHSYELLHTLKGHQDGIVNCVSFNDESTLLASASNDKLIKIWDCKTGECLKTIAGNNDFVASVSFSFSGQQIVSISKDNKIRIWDVKTGGQINVFDGHTEKTKAAIFYADDSKVLTASNRLIRIWDVASGVVLSNMERQRNSDIIHSVFVHPIDKCIFAVYNDGEYDKWSFPSLVELIDDTKRRFNGMKLLPRKLKEFYLE